MGLKNVSNFEERQKWREHHLQLWPSGSAMSALPKIELHVHIEGTMTPELRWKLSQRNSIPLTTGTQKIPLKSLEETKAAYGRIRGRIGAASADASKNFTFFEAYYGGFDLLQKEEDFYDLAMDYFERAAQMNVRYCEPFFDPQGHTRRGLAMEIMMKGFSRAQQYAEKYLNVKSQWIMCFLRDMSPESAMEQYEAGLPYKDMIAGIGLDSDEYDRPPMLFAEVFKRAREDGFHITSHCDFNQKDTHEHIRQVVEELGGNGGERIDHGLNAADDEKLVEMIKEKGIGMTICPCAYIRHTSIDEVFPRIQVLLDTGIKITIASDDPAYMEDNWVLHNLCMIMDKCQLTLKDIVQLQQNAIDICWASRVVKEKLNLDLEEYRQTYDL